MPLTHYRPLWLHDLDLQLPSKNYRVWRSLERVPNVYFIYKVLKFNFLSHDLNLAFAYTHFWRGLYPFIESFFWAVSHKNFITDIQNDDFYGLLEANSRLGGTPCCWWHNKVKKNPFMSHGLGAIRSAGQL